MAKKTYQAPVIRLVGSLRDLTQLAPKNTTTTPDGFTFQGVSLTS
jgi:hypothetical protein